MWKSTPPNGYTHTHTHFQVRHASFYLYVHMLHKEKFSDLSRILPTFWNLMQNRDYVPFINYAIPFVRLKILIWNSCFINLLTHIWGCHEVKMNSCIHCSFWRRIAILKPSPLHTQIYHHKYGRWGAEQVKPMTRHQVSREISFLVWNWGLFRGRKSGTLSFIF